MVSFGVSLYHLFLSSDRNSTTGWYNRGYSVCTLDMAIFPRGTSISLAPYYTRYSLTGFTEYNVDEGDVVFDTLGKYYQVLSVKPWCWGDKLSYFECELEEIPYFALPTSEALFYGYEDVDHGTIGSGYGDEFERGYMIETTF
jgi:hypothetical protein